MDNMLVKIQSKALPRMCLKRQTSRPYYRLVKAETSKGILTHRRVKEHNKIYSYHPVHYYYYL